jgi:hypothetical protein
MRTYDQILGDMPEGNGDPSKVLFGEKITPNFHRLAREFVLFDNFYCAGDIGKDGFYWTFGGIAPDSTVRTWPIESSHRLPQPSRYEEGPEGARTTPDGLLWDRAAENHVSFYNYGFLAVNRPRREPVGAVQIEDVLDPVLKPRTSYYYRQDRAPFGYDHVFPDRDRVKIFLRDLAGWEKTGEMPRLIFMALGNDHTDGTSPGRFAPNACMADTDLALGLVAEAVSHSRFWPETAVFVLYDDPQDGTDHVDSHRAAAWVISPYARRRAVDSTFYNSLSALRTIELILGFQPMTAFDAAARPMAAAFQGAPDLTPYTHAPPNASLEERNPPKPR